MIYKFMPTSIISRSETFPRVAKNITLRSPNGTYLYDGPVYSCVEEKKQFITITHLNKYCMSRSVEDWDKEPWVSIKIREKGIYKITYERGGLKSKLSKYGFYNQGYYPEGDQYQDTFCVADSAISLPGKKLHWYSDSIYPASTRNALVCCSKENWYPFFVGAGWNSACGYPSRVIPENGITSIKELEEKRGGEANYFISSGEKELCFYYTGRQYDGPQYPPDFEEGEVIYSIQKVGDFCSNTVNTVDQEFE